MAGNDLSGEWRGHYHQDGGRHGISMRVVQTGAAFRGVMRDEDTLLMGTVGPEDAERLRELLSSSAEAPPETVTSLPEESTVEGRIDGDSFHFIKRYRGVQRTSLWLEDGEIQIELDGHCVHYRGRIEQDGHLLRGRWTLALDDAEGDDNGDADDGDDEGDAFQLLRVT